MIKTKAMSFSLIVSLGKCQLVAAAMGQSSRRGQGGAVCPRNQEPGPENLLLVLLLGIENGTFQHVMSR